MSEPAEAQRMRIAGFDGLRALGFLLVFLSHKVPTVQTEMYGSLGVWLFFVLSGFLMTRILAELRSSMDRGETTFWSALFKVYVRRSVRILPVFYVLLLALIPVSLIVKIGHFSPVEQVAYWTHTTNLYVAEHGWVGRFGHFWSLAVEVQYYVAFSLLALMLPRRWLWLLCCSFIVWGAVVNLALVRTSAHPILLDVHSALGFALFGLGGLAGLLADGAVARQATRPLIIAPALILYIATPILFRDSAQFLSFGRLSAILAVIVLIAFYRHPESLLVGIFEWRPLRQLGVVSYAAYLFHPLVSTSFLETALVSATDNRLLARLTSVGADLAITVALALASWRLIEKPAVDWGKRMTTGIRAA